MVQDASGGPFFSVLPEKNGEKRGAGRKIALTRRKAVCFCLPFAEGAPVKERPSGGRRIRFPKRTMRRAGRLICAR